MPLKYRLVKRKDMSKDAAEGAELYYAQTSISKKVDLNRICSRISKYSTVSRGDILLVLDGLITVMNESLADGESIHLGDFGSFRMVAGRKGFQFFVVQSCSYRILSGYHADGYCPRRFLREVGHSGQRFRLRFRFGRR